MDELRIKVNVTLTPGGTYQARYSFSSTLDETPIHFVVSWDPETESPPTLSSLLFDAAESIRRGEGKSSLPLARLLVQVEHADLHLQGPPGLISGPVREALEAVMKAARAVWRATGPIDREKNSGEKSPEKIMYRVTARLLTHVDEWEREIPLPTFFLDPDEQNIQSRKKAEAVARRILAPHVRPGESIHISVSLVEVLS